MSYRTNSGKRLQIILVTTIVGLLPMMQIGTNEFWETLAVIVIWGLVNSTTLLLVFARLREGRLTFSKKVFEQRDIQ